MNETELLESAVSATDCDVGRQYFADARKRFLLALLQNVLRVDAKGVPSNADKDNLASVKVALGISHLLKSKIIAAQLTGETSGNKFEEICATFVKEVFLKLGHLQLGGWDVRQASGPNRLEIAKYQQYAYLVALDKAARSNPELATALRSDYVITPDIIVTRETEADEAINARRQLVDEDVTLLASLRKRNGGIPLLHACISCKWTIQSDSAQNARSEGLNLVNRKGRLPHVVVITAEPLPSRLASIALGTGDIDCVYHFALNELQQTVASLGLDDAAEMLAIMVNGKRLKDISDLPLDLAV